MALIIEIALFKGFRKISLDAFTSKERAIKFYEKCRSETGAS